MKQVPMVAAAAFVEDYFPHCEAALLAGSVVRGEATPTSDLDIFVLIPALAMEYRESFFAGEWMVEVFVHNLGSYKKYFQSDCERGRPSLPRMVAEGVVLKDSLLLAAIKREASHLLAQGPQPWDAATIDRKRYFITDVLLDLIGSTTRCEEIFIVGRLSELLHEFIMRTNRQWIGNSKWIWKTMQDYEFPKAQQFFDVLEAFYRTGDKEKLIAFTDAILEPFGGRLFHGFSLGKDKR